ncbi:hypothetical protein QR680_005519 [Steinernema hermaphroditum]|uniref:DNA2/NAM7 helicase-like C-terminal domain-containing protein n=1 Tax=Steinernema hermaphroditum TaxID=289476 RepID=A0AA39HSB1_9BILA|nr:hypothetical protein QR680_005519 [Steinernema hermaphroditum]
MFLDNFCDIPVHTVDAFIGCEADNVIISLPHSELGFLADEIDPITRKYFNRRVLVMLTRAKKKMFVIGHLNDDGKSQYSMLYQFLYNNRNIDTLICD